MNLLAKRSMRMTEGNIWKQIILFAVPMLIGNLFQQLYNTVDSMVVGNYVSTQALAAVGSVGPAINTLLGFFIGLSTGAGVVISRYFGAQDSQNLHDAVHTTMLLSLLAGVLMTVLGVLITPYLLQLMATPDGRFAGEGLESDMLPQARNQMGGGVACQWAPENDEAAKAQLREFINSGAGLLMLYIE